MWRAAVRPLIHARDRVAATRAVAYFLMAGGSVVGACALLVPGFAGGTTLGVLTTEAMAGAMVAAGALCRLVPQRVPEAFWVAVPFLAVLLIGVLNLVTRDVSVSAHLYFLWPLLYAATFVRRDIMYVLLVAASLTDAVVTFWIKSDVTAVTDIAALVTAYAVSTIVVSKLRARSEALVALLEEQALTDALTGLPNRRAFDLDLDRALHAGAERALLIIDVDHFKTINDTWGHGTGDAVLTRVGAALRAAAGPGDCPARLGGDEFAVVVAGGEERARAVAAQVRAHVASSSDLSDGLPTLSIGLATTADLPAPTAETLLAAADRALYDAKVRGRDRVASTSTRDERRKDPRFLTTKSSDG
ncbi:diguanylate cyclase domain-containing protein [Dactylosporangium sp. CA-139114]|uniref:GGDEF domain-containing protein n=1 Tax=Dactylosporangium sp. CA-139114 TaxID=3239931 RepID=UPI003D97237F